MDSTLENQIKDQIKKSILNLEAEQKMMENPMTSLQKLLNPHDFEVKSQLQTFESVCKKSQVQYDKNIMKMVLVEFVLQDFEKNGLQGYLGRLVRKGLWSKLKLGPEKDKIMKIYKEKIDCINEHSVEANVEPEKAIETHKNLAEKEEEKTEFSSYLEMVDYQIAKLNKEKAVATSKLTSEEFFEGIANFDDKTNDDHWSLCMKSYFQNGDWFGSQYKLLTAPKSFTIDDFLHHYNLEFHKTHFSRATHAQVNKLYLIDNKTSTFTLILIFVL